jgi:hypothetical protein
VTSGRRKPEDSVEGCRALEQADRLRAMAISNPHARESLERSADAWAARATLLDRLDTNFNARVAENAGDQRKRKDRPNG